MEMWMLVPARKLQRSGKYLLLAGLVCFALGAYLHFSATSDRDIEASPYIETLGIQAGAARREPLRVHSDVESNESWKAQNPSPWYSQNQGQANLHIFEDWCGSSVQQLRKNLHYPLYPHSRSTVSKLAIAPRWTNYGLRIFGYLHPNTDGKFVFAVACDDNCEFWLSSDESPSSIQLLAAVGKTGREWTAPGEFVKYSSQMSKPVPLLMKQKYFFELIHKQDNKGTDHVEVAWRLNKAGSEFAVVDSKHISLYTNESSLKMSDVAHIPQTTASHVISPSKTPKATSHGADMLQEDPRDTFHQLPLINPLELKKILPTCYYSPSYTIKDYPLSRYQGLQFVYLTSVYPNDYTRLTHMEEGNKCFYKSVYHPRLGFSWNMYLDGVGYDTGLKATEGGRGRFRALERERQIKANAVRDNVHHRQRKVLSLRPPEHQDPKDQPENLTESQKLNREGKIQPMESRNSIRNHLESKHPIEEQKPIPFKNLEHGQVQKEKEAPVLAQGLEEDMPSEKAQSDTLKSIRVTTYHHNSKLGTSKEQLNPGEHWVEPNRPIKAGQNLAREPDHPIRANQNQGDQQAQLHRNPSKLYLDPVPKDKQPLMDGEIASDIKSKRNSQLQIAPPPAIAKNSFDGMEIGVWPKVVDAPKEEGANEDYEENEEWHNWDEWEEPEELVPTDVEVNWAQTFQLKLMDLHKTRTDWIDLTCNVSGNLLLDQSDALAVVQSFMDKLNSKTQRQYTLVQVVNVEKREDSQRGSRYLLELELLDGRGRQVRVSQFVYLLPNRSGYLRRKKKPVLCNPVSFQWNPRATVHFIVPVKNQARWVQQFISDMEELYQATGDQNFNIIITDYDSTDMDILQSLQKASLPSYQYVRLSGNFERAAGLQSGIDLIKDKHSIVFLCDLHIHFPMGFVESVRKHCVEGKMAFAPIVMRLNCGASPQEPDGFWEVNGFGLLGIYKSDLVAAGGMNTQEFKNSWGGEDWELLDRILQSGLEVERLYLRNFLHHYHSKRGMWNRQMLRTHT